MTSTIIPLLIGGAIGAAFGAFAMALVAATAQPCRHCGERDVKVHIEDMTWSPATGPSSRSPFKPHNVSIDGETVARMVNREALGQ